MQVFNYINCRKIGQNEINVFERLFTRINWYFWFTILFVTFLQIAMVQIFFAFTRTTPLTRSEWGACMVTGSTVLLVAALLKLTGSKVLKKIPFTKFIDEDKE
jgi:magnesium-transporting ATPase (P-type)